MASRNVEAHRTAHENWSRRDFDALVSEMVENFTYRDHARGLRIDTRDGFKDYVAAWAELFSDGAITDDQYRDAGDSVVSEFIVRGTNDGPLGSLPATGRSYTGHLCEIMDFDSEGRIVSGCLYYDQLSMLVQLGHAELPQE